MSDYGKWVHSTTEIYRSDQFDTKEEAIADGKECHAGAPFDIGQTYEVTFSIDGDDILETLSVQLHDEIGEASEDAFCVGSAAVAELGDLLTSTLNEWLDDQCQPSCFGVKDIERIIP